MAYIGSTPTSQNFISGTDYFNGTGSQTAFTLTRSVNSVNDVEVVVNNVIQQPNSYTISGTTLTLSAAPSSGTSNVYVRYLATNQQSFTVGNNTVGYNQLTADMQSKFAMKNRIINGAMVIDQRNAGAAVNTNGASDTYVVDRFYIGDRSGTGVMTGQQTYITSLAGFTYSLKATTSTANASLTGSQYVAIRQTIEGYNIADFQWGTSYAKTITLSFWVQSSLTGTFGGALNNSAFNRCYVFSYSIPVANTWTQISITIPGDTTGTWNFTNGQGINLFWGLGVGTTVSGTAGSWGSTAYYSATGATSVVGTNGATFYITGVQLEAGSSATGFEYRQYQQELALCQRYYYKALPTNNNGIFGLAQVANATGAAVITPFPVPLRATPTAVEQTGTAGNYKLWQANTVAVACTSVPVYASSTSVVAGVTSFTASTLGGTAGQVSGGLGNGTGYLAWSAEL